MVAIAAVLVNAAVSTVLGLPVVTVTSVGSTPVASINRVYRPSHATVHNLDTTAELRWARTCPVQCEDTFGLFSPGVLTFHVDGVGAVGVEARHIEGIAAMSGHDGPR